MKKAIVSVALFVVLVSSSTVHASWFSDLVGTNIDPWAGKFQIGLPNPAAIQQLPAVIQRLPQDVANLANPMGLSLAIAIRQAKAQALFSARSVPPYVQQKLSTVFPPTVLQAVRYTTFNSARISLDSAVMLLNNDVVAITLEDVIVFRSEQDAQDVTTWAHELTHVLQYMGRGIDTFANMYTTNSWVLENQAKDVAARVGQALAAEPVGGEQQVPQNFAYFVVNGGYWYGDANQYLYPADPNTGRVLGGASGRVVAANGGWIAIDFAGRQSPAQRVR
jgi:hypothetical protein